MARRKHREGQGLHKVLGVPALFSTAYGNVGSSIYYALGVVALSALGVTPLVFIATGMLFVTTAWSYAEATAMLPEAGGSSSFARRAFNEFVSFGAGWALMLDYIITIAISAFFVPNYLAVFWPVLKTWPSNTIGGIVTVIFLVIINVVGIKEAARLNIVLAILDLMTQVLLMVLGVILLVAPKLLFSQVIWGVAPTWRQLIYGISIGTVAYTGIETVSNMAEEAARPDRDVPRAINYVLAAVLVVYAGISITALSAMPVKYNVMPVDKATGKTVEVAVVAKDPEMPNGPFVFKDSAASRKPRQQRLPPGHPQGVAVVHRAARADRPRVRPERHRLHEAVRQSAGQRLQGRPGGGHRQQPAVVTGLAGGHPAPVGRHPGRDDPHHRHQRRAHRRISSGVLHGAASPDPTVPRARAPEATHAVRVDHPVRRGGVRPDHTGQHGLARRSLCLWGHDLVHGRARVGGLAALQRAGDLRAPSARRSISPSAAGAPFPVLAVIGGIGTFTVWCVVVATHAQGRTIGFIWMGVGLATYVIYRKAKGYSLTKTVEKVVVPESMQADVDYDQILVPIVGSRVTDEMMVLACQLATEKKSSIDGLYVIEVPLNLPLDARLVNERDKAATVLKAAAAIASQFKVKFTPHIVTARQAGRAIVEEAVDRRSEVIILGTTRKRRIGNLVFGRTADFVLDHAPCEVLLNLVPREYPTGGSSSDQQGGSQPGGGT